MGQRDCAESVGSQAIRTRECKPTLLSASQAILLPSRAVEIGDVLAPFSCHYWALRFVQPFSQPLLTPVALGGPGALLLRRVVGRSRWVSHLPAT